MSDFSKPRVNGKMLPSFKGRTVCLLGNAKDVSLPTQYLFCSYWLTLLYHLVFSSNNHDNVALSILFKSDSPLILKGKK